jgi:hypothetical protein
MNKHVSIDYENVESEINSPTITNIRLDPIFNRKKASGS